MDERTNREGYDNLSSQVMFDADGNLVYPKDPADVDPELLAKMKEIVRKENEQAENESRK